MKTKIIFSVIACVTLFLGCAPSNYKKNFEEHEYACDFKLYTVPPTQNYEEVGVINLEPSSPFSERVKKLDTVKWMIEKPVCEQGANGVLLWQNDRGEFIKATLLKVKHESYSNDK